MRRILSIVASVRTAIILIIIIVCLCAFGSGREGVFRSPVFLIPLALFSLNLTACMLRRLIQHPRRVPVGRLGPDLIHFGVLLLIIAGVLTAAGMRKTLVYLKEGDTWGLPNGYALKLLEFRFEVYPDGRPKDWISRVRVSRQGKTLIDEYSIEVNRPLIIAGFSIYQSAFRTGRRITVEDSRGGRYEILNGEPFPAEAVSGGGTMDELRVVAIDELSYTGLEAVRDPGSPLMIFSFLLIAGGLGLTFLGKKRTKR